VPATKGISSRANRDDNGWKPQGEPVAARAARTMSVRQIRPQWMLLHQKNAQKRTENWHITPEPMGSRTMAIANDFLIGEELGIRVELQS
jgi:hypothetical protein